jgi:hypothetical protein
MASGRSLIQTFRRVVEDFCREFVIDPYLCYTEHGQHALFFAQLYAMLAPEDRYTVWQGHRLCVLQKEYPTATALGKSKRQHWDVALIKTPPSSISPAAASYDYLRLLAAVEFAMNATPDHLKDDIRRLCHPEANTDHPFVVHFYRLSPSDSRVSGRDWSPDANTLLAREDVASLVSGSGVEVYYGVSDSTGTNESGLWRIGRDGVARLV